MRPPCDGAPWVRGGCGADRPRATRLGRRPAPSGEGGASLWKLALGRGCFPLMLLPWVLVLPLVRLRRVSPPPRLATRRLSWEGDLLEALVPSRRLSPLALPRLASLVLSCEGDRLALALLPGLWLPLVAPRRLASRQLSCEGDLLEPVLLAGRWLPALRLALRQLSWKGDLLELALLPGLRLLLVALARLASRVLSCEGDLRGIFVERLVLEVGLDVCGRWLPLLFLVPALARLASRALSCEGDLWRVPFLLRALTMLASRVLSWEGDLWGSFGGTLALNLGLDAGGRRLLLLPFPLLALARLASRVLSWEGDRLGVLWSKLALFLGNCPFLLAPAPLPSSARPRLASRVVSWEGDLGGGGLWKLVLLRGCRPTSLALPRLASRALSCDGDRRGGWAREPVLVLRGGRLLPPPPLLAAELPKLAPPSRAYSSGSGIFLPSFLSIFFARSPSSFSPRSSTRPSAISLLSSLGRDSPELPSPSWSNPMESQNFASLLLRLRSWDMYVTFSRSLSSIWRCISSAHALYLGSFSARGAAWPGVAPHDASDGASSTSEGVNRTRLVLRGRGAASTAGGGVGVAVRPRPRWDAAEGVLTLPLQALLQTLLQTLTSSHSGHESRRVFHSPVRAERRESWTKGWRRQQPWASMSGVMAFCFGNSGLGYRVTEQVKKVSQNDNMNFVIFVAKRSTTTHLEGGL